MLVMPSSDRFQSRQNPKWLRPAVHCRARVPRLPLAHAPERGIGAAVVPPNVFARLSESREGGVHRREKGEQSAFLVECRAHHAE